MGHGLVRLRQRPFAGPEQVLAYLSRYTDRVAISNSRLISADQSGVTFTYKDYRIDGPERYTTMTLEPGEFTSFVGSSCTLQDLRCTVGASEIPIAPLDRGAHLPRFPSLAAFVRRPGSHRAC